MKKVIPYLLAISLAGFGLLTLFLSTSVIFDLFDIRVKEGNYVLFIVWANFLSSFLYLFAAYGFVKSKKWTSKILFLAFIILITAFIGLKTYINSGGVFETKTVNALFFRTTFTAVFSIIAYYIINIKHKNHD